jgi:hypothetical protein
MDETNTINNIDYAKLNEELETIQQTITTLTYILYYMAGATTVLIGGTIAKLSYTFCYKKRNVIHLTDESVRLINSMKSQIPL